MTRQTGKTDRTGHRVIALCGGIGGAKLALGLYDILPPGALSVVVNTGDDFEHLGLHISPDLDTVTYTLAGLADPERGWGRAAESWTMMAALEELGADTWFSLGDKDLATHITRTQKLSQGQILSGITRAFCETWGIHADIMPMTDDRVRTMLETDRGALAFQDYFVRQRAEPEVRAIRYEGSEAASPPTGVMAQLSDPTLSAVIICPSNPYLSIDPILAVPGIAAALRECGAPVIAISSIIGGKAVKGPTAKLMAELGVAPDASSIAAHYDGLLDGFILDASDARLEDEVAVPSHMTDILMRTHEDKTRLARTCLVLADEIASRGEPAKRNKLHAT